MQIAFVCGDCVESANRLVLIVDDEPSVSEVIGVMIESPNIAVETALNGLEALELIRTKKYDCIISDIRMPEMSGIEMARELRKMNCKVPIIFVTGFANTKLINECWSLGAFDFFNKPLDAEEIKNAVNKALLF